MADSEIARSWSDCPGCPAGGTGRRFCLLPASSSNKPEPPNPNRCPLRTGLCRRRSRRRRRAGARRAAWPSRRARRPQAHRNPAHDRSFRPLRLGQELCLDEASPGDRGFEPRRGHSGFALRWRNSSRFGSMPPISPAIRPRPLAGALHASLARTSPALAAEAARAARDPRAAASEALERLEPVPPQTRGGKARPRRDQRPPRAARRGLLHETAGSQIDAYAARQPDRNQKPVLPARHRRRSSFGL